LRPLGSDGSVRVGAGSAVTALGLTGDSEVSIYLFKFKFDHLNMNLTV
jgi:hypothetical protein